MLHNLTTSNHCSVKHTRVLSTRPVLMSARAQRKGNVGEAQCVREQNHEIAKINAEIAVSGSRSGCEVPCT